MTRPSVVPSATLPTSSWPSVANESSEKLGRRVDERAHAAEHQGDEDDDDDVRGHDERERERRERPAARASARGCRASPTGSASPRARPRGARRRASAGVVSDRVNGIIGRAATKNNAVTATRTKTHCTSVAQPSDLAPLRTVAKSSSAPPARAMSERASVLIGDRLLTVCSSTSLQRVRAGRDPGDEVAREVRQPERREQLARQRPGEEKKADGGDGPEAAVRLGDDARHVEDEGAEAPRGAGCASGGRRRPGALRSSTRSNGRPLRGTSLDVPSRRAARRRPRVSTISPAARSARRRRAGPTNSPTVAARAETTSTRVADDARESQREGQADAHRERSRRHQREPDERPCLARRPRAGREQPADDDLRHDARRRWPPRRSRAAPAMRGSRSARPRGRAPEGGPASRSARPSRGARARGAVSTETAIPMKKHTVSVEMREARRRADRDERDAEEHGPRVLDRHLAAERAAPRRRPAASPRPMVIAGQSRSGTFIGDVARRLEGEEDGHGERAGRSRRRGRSR